MAAPIKPTNYISEVLTGQTAAQWAASGGSVYLQAFETVIEQDTGKRKTGPGLFSELPYDNPQGQTWENTAGTPTSTDLIGYTAVTAAVTATAEWTCDDVGTAGATIIVGGKLYTVVASGATGPQINAGATATEYADNIATKVTTDTASTLCTAENASAVITFTANTTGVVGNDIPLSTTDENITADVFVDGADAVYTPKATSAAALNPLPNVRTITGDDTITQADNGKIISAEKATAIEITVTGPFDAGFNCLVVQTDDGAVEFVQGSNCGLQQREGNVFTAGLWAVCSLVSPDDDIVVLGGDLAAS